MVASSLKNPGRVFSKLEYKVELRYVILYVRPRELTFERSPNDVK